jgi:hypothetical protein
MHYSGEIRTTPGRRVDTGHAGGPRRTPVSARTMPSVAPDDHSRFLNRVVRLG